MKSLSLFVLVPTILSVGLASLIHTDEDIGEFSKDALSSLRRMLIQNILRPKDLEDTIISMREAGPKRAHVRRFDQLPPGFVGVRGKKEKSKIKEPVPGFLGVRGKKIFHLSNLINESVRSSDDRNPITREKCIQNESWKDTRQ